MLTELIEFGCKMTEEMKAIKNEIQENIQGTNSVGEETGTQINGLDQKEKKNIQPEQNEEEFKKIKRGLGASGTTLNVPTSES